MHLKDDNHGGGLEPVAKAGMQEEHSGAQPLFRLSSPAAPVPANRAGEHACYFSISQITLENYKEFRKDSSNFCCIHLKHEPSTLIV